MGEDKMSQDAQFSLARRDLLKGGALVIGFALGGRALAQAPPGAEPPPATPDPGQVDTWLAIHPDTTATLFLGFVELGQGTTTALPQVAAEELDLDLGQIRVASVETNVTPNQGGTYSSASIFRGSPQVRAAAAEARQALLQMASTRLNAPVEQLVVAAGLVSAAGAPGRKVSYGELIGDKRFDLKVSGKAPVKSPDKYRIVGRPERRKDIPAKVSGQYGYIQHERLEGMLHARVVRPRGQRAYGAGAKVISVDEGSISSIPGARVARRGDFLAVVAPREWDAVKAARQLKVVWDDAPTLPNPARLHDQMRAEQTTDTVVLERGDAAAALKGATQSVSMTCECPYQAHAPFAPNCALADVRSDGALVICTSQDIYNLRRELAPVLGLPEARIRVQFRDASGTYGHSCYDDVGQAAAITSQIVGKPVRLQFMRWDEHGWDTYGPAHLGEVRVAAGPDGKITGYSYNGWQHNWSQVEASQQLALGTAATEWPTFPSQQVATGTCGGQYAIPNIRLVNHHVPGQGYLRGAWLRSPLDLSFAFTSEQAIDQLAYKLGLDPYEFRRRNIADERWLGVLDAAAKAAGWTPRRAASGLSDAPVVSGRGIGLGTHLQSWGGAVAEIEVDKASGRVRIKHLYGAIDAGLVVNPDNVESQITGQLVQTASRMLFEEVRFDEHGVTSLDWQGYPVIRFEDCPEVTPVVVQRLNEKSLGAGEEVMAAAAAAIANAFFDATGRRMTRYPLTPERVKAALAGASLVSRIRSSRRLV
jgi:nicotinate dehydrogenase subunit B